MNRIKEFFKDYVNLALIVVAILGYFVINDYINEGEHRDKWIAACKDMGGIPRMVGNSNRIRVGLSICIKPNSILTVTVSEDDE